MKPRSMIIAMTAMMASLFSRGKKDPFNTDPQTARHGKSKGGGRGKGMLLGRQRFAPAYRSNGGGWGKANRASRRDKGPARAKRFRSKGYEVLQAAA